MTSGFQVIGVARYLVYLYYEISFWVSGHLGKLLMQLCKGRSTVCV